MSTNALKSDKSKSGADPVSHRVVVFGVHDDSSTLEKVLASIPGGDRPSAKHLVRTLPGIIPRMFDRNGAAAIARDIRNLGLHAAALPATEVPDFSHSEKTHHLRAFDDSLEVMNMADEVTLWPWDAVTVISVGVVPTTVSARQRPSPALAQGTAHRRWNTGSTIAPKSRAEAFVVLTVDRPVLTFASDEMNYEFLGSRMTGSSSANFRKLIKDLISHAPGAWVTPSTRAFVDRSPIRHCEFRSHDDFRKYTEFQTLLSGHSTNVRS